MNCRIALVGFGTVGSSVVRLLQTRSASCLQLTHICNRGIARKKTNWLGTAIRWTESFDDVLGPDVDVVVELIGGVEDARQLVERALAAGKSVVTANKQLMAHFGPQLLKLAGDSGQHLGFGACVAGGIPVLSALQHGLAGDELIRIRGILNGTCNYILSRMQQANVPFADALAEAQRAGFAEADPTEDVDGHDAAAKLAILASIAFGKDVSPRQVTCRSIGRIGDMDFAYAQELGCTIKQVSTAELHDKLMYLNVGPALVACDSPLAKVSANQNLVVTTGEFGGDTSFGGYGAGGDPTAVAVVSDLLQAARHCRNRTAVPRPRLPAPCKVTYDVESRQYLRFVVRDRPGILAVLAAALARHDINVDAVLQRPEYPKSALPFVITLEPCGQRKLQAGMAEIAGCDFLLEPVLAIPILR
jgi:homoserine dehydrogenase